VKSPLEETDFSADWPLQAATKWLLEWPLRVSAVPSLVLVLGLARPVAAIDVVMGPTAKGLAR